MNLNESVQWEANVYSINELDAAQGATGGDPNTGVVNAAPLQLANRTKYLKAVVDGIGLPFFGFPGLYSFSFDNGLQRFFVHGSNYKNETGIYNTEFDCYSFPYDNGSMNPGVTILRQNFNMPYGYTKLNLTFLAKSDRSLGGLNGVRTMIFGNNATANSYDMDLKASSIIQGITLSQDPIIREVQLDLSAVTPGSPLMFLHCISNPAAYHNVDYTVNCGQLRSSWEV